jgi:class 3 adenylate cyclase
MTEVEHLPALSSVIQLRLLNYAQRPVAEQARLSAQLDTVLAMLLPDIPERSRIVLAGSGRAAVAVLDNASAALTFAEHALTANQAGLGLCIGIDHGPVEILPGESGDVLAGDGVVTASVMAAFATDAKLLVSQNFRTALAHKSPGSEGVLVPAENFSDAGLRTYQAFRLDRYATQQRRRRLIVVAVTSVILLLSIAMVLRIAVPDRPRPLAPYIGSTVSTAIDKIIRLTHGQP